MRIGPYLIDPPVVLAPMAGVTDKPFRQLCKRLGAGLAVSEMTTADPRLWTTRKSLKRMDHVGEPAPVSVQIAGYDPAMLAEAARYNVDHGAQIIDINMGCPAKKVCNVWSGSALLQDESLVARILDAVVRAVDVPVTLKIRTGWNRDHRNGLLHRAGSPRTPASRRSPCTAARARIFTKAKPSTKRSPRSSRRSAFRCSRTATSIRPQKATRGARFHALRCGHDRPRGAGPAVDLRRDRALPRDRRSRRAARAGRGARHPARPSGRSLCVLRRTAGPSRIARKHLGWYAKDRPENAAFRAVVNRAESASEQVRLTRDYFDALAADVVPELAAAA